MTIENELRVSAELKARTAPKPTRSAPPRLLPNGQPDQSNVVFSDEANRWVLAAIARGLPYAAGPR